MPLNRIENAAEEMLRVHERIDLCDLARRQQLQIHAQIAAARLGHFQPVHALAGAGQHEPTGHVHAAGLAGDPLDFFVELDGVLLELGDVGIAVDRVHAAGGVPGRARSQFGTLKELHVLPAHLGQVVQNARAHDPAADDHHSHVCFHMGILRNGGR